jgi:glycosyltransferase involved in cell wall biosynthesis
MKNSKRKVCEVETNEKPLISIILPVFNTEKQLDRCIKSLINQTYEKIEIILIDDGSTDKSLDRCLFFKQQDSRIYCFHQENSGVSSARNRGIEEAKGDFITFVDSDDWIDGNVCETFFDAYQKNNCDLFCYSAVYHKKRSSISSYLFPNDIDILTPEQKQELQRKVFTPYAPDFGYNVNTRFAGSACGKFYKRNILIDKNLQFSKETTISEDCLFNTYALDSFERIGYTRKSCYHYVQQEDSAQNRYRPNSDMYFSFVIKQIQKWLKETNKNQQFIDSANCLFVHYLFGILKEDIFHRDNRLSWINRKNLLNQVLKMPEYSVALQSINRNYFSFPEKMLISLLKNRCINTIRLLFYVV